MEAAEGKVTCMFPPDKQFCPQGERPSDAYAPPVLVIRDGIFESANRQARELLGVDATGFPLTRVFDARSAAKVERLLQELGSSPQSSELQIQRPGRPLELVRFIVISLTGGSAVL